MTVLHQIGTLLFGNRVYTTALLLIASTALFAGWLIGVDAFRPFAMTVGGSLAGAYLATAIVFANKPREVREGWLRPIDFNVVVTVIALGIIVVSLLASFLKHGDFLTSTLDALMASAAGGVGAVIMAFAKQDAG